MTEERIKSSPGLEVFLELMHHIQSRLKVKEAARTSVLSKSWLYAWSTIPTLRFDVQRETSKMLVHVDRTLIRYLRDNIPIESFVLMIDIENRESASLVRKWIRCVATKTCLKEISLTIHLYGASLDLPDEILSGENVAKIKVSVLVPERGNYSVRMKTCYHPKCVSLRELHLSGVRISDQVLHDILSSCRILEKIELLACSQNVKTIKVKSLHCLYQLHIATVDKGSTALEINDVPNLRILICNVHMTGPSKRPLINTHSISLGSNVTELTLGGGVITDNASLDMFFKSGLPFLESLTLNMHCWKLRSFHFKCASIKRFSLRACPPWLFDVVHVYAPKLIFFSFDGPVMPSLSFPDSTLEEIDFRLDLKIPGLDASFFIKMREALTLSRKCDLQITTKFNNHGQPPFDIDIDSLRTRLRFPPAMNVELSFQTTGDECMWESSPFFDALFEICHPEHVFARPDSLFKHKNHFCWLMLRKVLEKNKNKATTTAYWRPYLKHVQISSTHHEKWETLTDSHTSFLDTPGPAPIQFSLNWR